VCTYGDRAAMSRHWPDCAEYHLKLLFDAAHAFGCSHEGRMIGSFGDAEVFSFHATKFSTRSRAGRSSRTTTS
jgi:dTDP-4-amino-4,6-dideoxygalactose transaminase